MKNCKNIFIKINPRNQQLTYRLTDTYFLVLAAGLGYHASHVAAVISVCVENACSEGSPQCHKPADKPNDLYSCIRGVESWVNATIRFET